MNGLDEKGNVAPGNQPDTTQEYVIELSESEISEIEAEAAEYEKFKKAFVYSIDADTEKHEITITLPEGQNQLVLPESWVHSLIDQLVNQTREWCNNQ